MRPAEPVMTPADRSNSPPIISNATATAGMPIVEATSVQFEMPSRRRKRWFCVQKKTAIKGASSSAKLATFDLSPDVIKDIQAGTIEFAIDQQQYLQGYLPIVFLKLYKENANTVGGGLPVLTGPGFVDKANAATVSKLAEAGTR